MDAARAANSAAEPMKDARERLRLRLSWSTSRVDLGTPSAQLDVDHISPGDHGWSLICKHGVNLSLVREDNADQMANLGEALKRGEAEPRKGAHFVTIMGDGSAQFLKGLNDRLAQLGPDVAAAVVGSAGYSRGEDKFMGPPAWRDDPQAARGGLVVDLGVAWGAAAGTGQLAALEREIDARFAEL